MESKMSYSLVFVSFLLISCLDLSAQPGLNIYTDLGGSNVSQGLFVKSAVLASLQSGDNLLEAGFQADLRNTNNKVFPGFRINASRNFKINNLPLVINGFWIITPFSELLRETNWGGLLKHENKHFGFAIGSNFRTYAFRQKAIREYGIADNARKIHETLNLMYSLDYQLKPRNSGWNVGFTLTNIDNFLIEQETNPMLRLNGFYRLSAPLSFYIQAWYKSAGATNLAVNYFGFFIRTGLLWTI